MILDTKRLLLREFQERDTEEFAILMGNPEVMQFSLTGPLDPVKAKKVLRERIIEHYKIHGFGLWAVIHKEKGSLIGIAGLIMQTIDGKEETEVGYRLKPEFWGQGFAVEATRAICEYAFANLKVKYLISIIDPLNTRSLKVAERNGMHFWKTYNFMGTPVHIYAIKRVIVIEFQNDWKYLFEKEKNQLNQVFKDAEICFEHIGSTSIPGCAAKPIIDILGITTEVALIDAFNGALEKIGYTAKGQFGIPQRRFFTKKYEQSVNLHVFEETDPEVERHLRFRDFLINQPEKMQEYSKLKNSLAKQFPHDVYQYCLGKEKFVKQTDFLAAQKSKGKILNFSSKPQKKVWTRQEIIQAMEVNTHLHMTYFAKYIPSLEVIFEPDVTVVRSEIQDDTFNYVIAAKFTDSNLKRRVPEIIQHYREKGLPFSWWVNQNDSPRDLEECLQGHGLKYKEEDVGMYLELDKFQPTMQTPLHFRRVSSQNDLKDFCQVIVNIGGNPDAYDLIYSKVPPLLYQDGSPFEMYVAYLNEKPVTTGILVLDAQVAGIYYVATTTEQRKKGFGRAMMEHLLQRAQSKKYFISTLQASQEGKGLYEKMGYQKLTLIREYAWKPEK